MPAGWHGRSRRTRHATAALAGALCLALAGAACSVSGGRAGQGGHAAPAGHLRPTARSSPAGPATAAAPLALQITPAAYQLPTGIAREVVLPDGRNLLIAGGMNQGSATIATVTLLDTTTGRTTRAGRLAAATHDAAGAVLGGRPYVFGGGAAASFAQVQALAVPGTASTAGSLPTPRSDLAAVTLGRTAYLVGGYDGLSYDSRVLATTDGTAFRTVARLPVAVRYPAVAGLGHLIWVFGGETASGPTRDIQRIDVATGKSSIAGRLPAPMMGASAFTLGGRIYLAGGQVAAATGVPASPGNPSGMVTTSGVLGFSPADHRVAEAGRLPVPVANAAVAVVGGTAFLIGGNNGQRQVPTVTTLRLVTPASALPAADPAESANPLSFTAAEPAGTSAPDAAAAAISAGGSLLTYAPWLAPAHGPGHLAPGSNPSVLPGDILIADAQNNRILIVDPHGRIRWQFPRRGDLRPGQQFRTPDDAFFSPNGKYIIATEEDYSVISVIDIATHRIVYRYGTPGVPGSAANYLSNPDDAMMMPDGKLISADIKNCRLLLLSPPSHRPRRVYGQTGVCTHNPPLAFGSPNGAFPATDGQYVVTEINGDWASEMSLSGHVSWSVHPPGVLYPSDTNEVYPGRYLTADYSSAGQVVEFNSRGRLLWRFGGLNHPSLALPLPNGDILVNDDYNDRVIVIDPVTNRIVWQYGHTGVPGRAAGYLNDPDGVDLAPPNSMLITHGPTMGQP